MPYQKHINSLPVGVDRFSTTDIQAANDYINAHVASHRLDVLDSPKGVMFDCNRWSVGDFQVCDFSYGDCEVDITLNSCEEEGFFIVVPLNGQVDISSKGDSYSLKPGLAMAFTTQDAANTLFHDSNKFRNINIGTSYQAIKSFLANEFDLPVTRDISFAKDPIVVSNEFQFLINYVRWFSSQIENHTHPSNEIESMLLNSSHLAHHIHDMLMSLLVSTVENNYQELYYSKNKVAAAPVYVRLAEEFIRENAREPITVTDVAREVGVAMRTLHMGFQRYRNYSVSEFLRFERLSLARNELATAKQRNISVTEVAFACGFMHLSKFSLAYQKKYGEKPSETRRKGN